MYKRTSYATTLLLLLTATLTTKKIQAQWDIEESHTTASLRGIHNVGGGVAWASGTNGTVLRTEDGGYLWQTCTIPPGAEKLDFRGIQAFDENTAIVMSSGKGDLSRLYKTTDGCQTWKLLFTNPDKEGFFDAVQMYWPQSDLLGHRFNPSRARGILAGDPVGSAFSIFTTNDGGDTWIRRVPVLDRKNAMCKVDAVEAKPGEAMFAASNQSLMGPLGADEFLMATGGAASRLIYIEHWDLDFAFCHQITHSLSLPFSRAGGSSGAFAFTKIPGESSGMYQFKKLIVVGGDYSKPDAPADSYSVSFTFSVLLRDRIKMESSSTPPQGYRSSVAFDAPSGALITVGPNGTDISRDDGKNWTPLKPSGYDPPDADKNWNALSLPFVVGPHGRIGRLRTIPNPPK
jgi:hypothetical protein